MNERIEQLVESIISDPSLNEEWPEFYESFRRDGTLYLHVFAEKFAELIVRDCVKNLEVHSTCFDGDVGRGIKIAARLTKEHFGVEE